nr:pentapeptide repeat-containing protein [Micromonospora sp. DSM 115978]
MRLDEGAAMAERMRAVSVRTVTELRHADWECRDITGETHERVAFYGVDLTEAVSSGASFTDCTFNDCKFNASEHSSSAFVNCVFTGCSFFDATFTSCKLVGSTFVRCTFGLFKVSGGDWSFVSLAGADLEKASIVSARMREADLTGAKLVGAAIQHVDLSGASLARANLTKADLRGSDLSTLDPLTAELRDAVIDADQAFTVATTLGLLIHPHAPRT